MKRRFNFTKFGRKNILLAAVSLLLIAMTAVTATASWIEDVSQVKFNTDDNAQQTPVHIGDNRIKADVIVREKPSGTADNEVVNLSDYFNVSGDMHLSPCYGDGENFYFPIEGGTNNPRGYRVGTKDDVNVNYLSTTFRIKSEEANTAYWFEKLLDNNNAAVDFVTFSGGNSEALNNMLRCSITVDGNTNVYAFNNTGTYHTLDNNNPASRSGRRVDQYMYYSEEYKDTSPEQYYKNSVNVTNKPNQGAGSNLNGNTLFTVSKYDANQKNTVKTVTVKLWLECNSSSASSRVSAANIATINLGLVSSWAKTRRIYVKDSTILQEGYAVKKWLSHNGESDNTAVLFWALKGKESTHNWKMTRVSPTSAFYYVDIPAVYNNVPAVLSRRKLGSITIANATWDNTSQWDYWETTFPDTYHSETYTVYSREFGTWEPADQVHCVYFVNSAFFDKVHDYMWDSKSVINNTDINAKVVKNANWPGKEMLTKMKTKTSSQSLDVYAFFYNSDYDRIIFNDGNLVDGANQEYQTQDLWLTNSSGTPLKIVNGTFDMSTLTWYHTNPSQQDNWSSRMPTYSADNTYLDGNFSTNNAWKKTRFAYGGEYSSTNGDAMKGTNDNNMIAKVYIKASGDYQFVVHYNGTCYKTWDDDGNLNLYDGDFVEMYPEGGNNDSHVIAKNLQKGVYRFYIQPIENNGIKIYMNSGEAHNTD